MTRRAILALAVFVGGPASAATLPNNFAAFPACSPTVTSVGTFTASGRPSLAKPMCGDLTAPHFRKSEGSGRPPGLDSNNVQHLFWRLPDDATSVAFDWWDASDIRGTLYTSISLNGDEIFRAMPAPNGTMHRVETALSRALANILTFTVHQDARGLARHSDGHLIRNVEIAETPLPAAWALLLGGLGLLGWRARGC